MSRLNIFLLLDNLYVLLHKALYFENTFGIAQALGASQIPFHALQQAALHVM
jgi:hypothetical protein